MAKVGLLSRTLVMVNGSRHHEVLGVSRDINLLIKKNKVMSEATAAMMDQKTESGLTIGEVLTGLGVDTVEISVKELNEVSAIERPNRELVIVR